MTNPLKIYLRIISYLLVHPAYTNCFLRKYAKAKYVNIATRLLCENAYQNALPQNYKKPIRTVPYAITALMCGAIVTNVPKK